MSYTLSQDGASALFTLGATGATAMVASPGASKSLLIRHISYHAATTTAARQTFSFLPSGGSNSFTRSVLTSGDTGEINIFGGWLLNTASGLHVAMSSSSVPTINFSIVYDIVDRSR